MKLNESPVSLLKASVAELLGTFLLALTMGVAIIGVAGQYADYQALYVPLAIGAVVAVLVYGLGPVSGGHFNPATSLGVFLVRRLSAFRLAAYLVAQIVGAALGFAMANVIILSKPQVPENITGAAIAAEALGAFLLVFTVAQVVYGRISASVSGLAVGLAWMVGLTVAQAASGGVLNPALALVLALPHGVTLQFVSTYLLAPILGGAVAAGLAAWFAQEKSA